MGNLFALDAQFAEIQEYLLEKILPVKLSIISIASVIVEAAIGDG